MARQDPFEIKMFLGKTFGHYLVRVTMAIAHHVVDLESPFRDPTTQARCLLSGLSQEEPWSSFRAKYQNFITLGRWEIMPTILVRKGGYESVCCKN